MKCNKCGKEMRTGYLFSSKDGAFSFADEVPSALINAKTAKGFVKITKLQSGGRIRLRAHICEDCRLVVSEY